MQDATRDERIRELMSRHLGWEADDDLIPDLPPFDITEPNIHDSKKEFLLERDTVRAVVDHIGTFILLLFENKEGATTEHIEMVARLGPAIDAWARRRHGNMVVGSARGLARKNVAAAGFFDTTRYVLLDIYYAYKQRLEDLEEQETEFWSVAHRLPNYYARTIALRFARFYAGRTKTYPTFGIARDGGHPSTDYGRILEQVFQILGIDADIRGPAERAIAQITDEDLNPPPKGVFWRADEHAAT